MRCNIYEIIFRTKRKGINMKTAVLIFGLLLVNTPASAQELQACTIGGCVISNGYQISAVTHPIPVSAEACQSNFDNFINGYGNQLCSFYGRGAYTIRCKASWG